MSRVEETKLSATFIRTAKKKIREPTFTILNSIGRNVCGDVRDPRGCSSTPTEWKRPAGAKRPMGNTDTGMTLTQCMPVVGGARSSYTPIRVAAVAG